MDVEYELSQQLEGHDGPVRCCCVLGDGALITAGGKGDAQVIMWRQDDAQRRFVAHKKLSLHQDYIFAMAASHSSPGGFYTGSSDSTAMRWDAEGNPVAQFLGHEKTVGSIAERGSEVVTGSWDATLRVWDAASGSLKHSIEAGVHAISVAILPTGDIVAGSQDKSLRVFRGTECVHRVDGAHGEIIKAISTSSSNMVTASNDNTLKMWSLDGSVMGTFEGHSSFVFDVAHTSDNDSIISASDDCTLKVWSLENYSIKQSILHGATVWQCAVLPNGDLLSACADNVARVWSRDPSRMAPEAERQAQKEIAEQSVMAAYGKGSSSVPMEGTADISEMPSTIGKKNGEIKCFKEGGSVFAYSWNAGGRTWDKIGEVVGSQSQKKSYEGDPVFPKGEYDFIFDVDMGPSRGIGRLPYNRDQNPMAVAESFCAREQIHKSNIDEIRKFIIENSGGGGGASAAGGSSGAGAAPSATPSAPEPPQTALLPVMSPAVYKDNINFEGLQKKLLEFNEAMGDDHKLTPVEVGHLTDAVAKLKVGVTSEFKGAEKEVVFVKMKEWPTDKMFPVVDLWRAFLVHPVSSDYFKGSDRGTAFITQVLGFLSTEPNGALGQCAAQYLANLFIFQTNRYAAFDKRDLLLKGVEMALASTRKQVKTAGASVLLNIAIVLHESSEGLKKWDLACAEKVSGIALAFLAQAQPADIDAVQRVVCAIGTLLPRDFKHGRPIATRCVDAGFLDKLRGWEDKVGGTLSQTSVSFSLSLSAPSTENEARHHWPPSAELHH
eukprot:CAMPEP_0176021228 /NCGR_PEP_ID=MMETSP0120_2-20121206/10303_1 /TAXON_ID=160619 /ORGANISM="Kryptoperidinium foliaceum, Strain CCMP 1326" /LENGTH=776 /DNA_ID=CAMNT_0017354339 /DNA_START=62 /DNA_END=2390 /DNA_ORIENTATION=-